MAHDTTTTRATATAAGTPGTHTASRPTPTVASSHDDFDIAHTTLQVDHEGGELLSIEPVDTDGAFRRRPPASA
jgi:hypothetical protein